MFLISTKILEFITIIFFRFKFRDSGSFNKEIRASNLIFKNKGLINILNICVFFTLFILLCMVFFDNFQNIFYKKIFIDTSYMMGNGFTKNTNYISSVFEDTNFSVIVHLTGTTFLDILVLLVCLLLLVVCLLVAVAFFTLSERKVMGSIQRRSGPNIVGFLGLLQPIADGVKLIIKEIIIPKRANARLFLLAPFIAFVLSLIG